MLQRTDDAHSVWAFYEDAVFTGWYVNFQAPMRRWAYGFDTHDHGVDIWVPAGGAWQWKDRDHVAGLVRVGRLTASEADEVWAETARVAAALDRGERWWSDWDGWQPDSRWPVPDASASLARLPGPLATAHPERP
jgi:predicted RNA-binding protein associated with RNAse of E/G family